MNAFARVRRALCLCAAFALFAAAARADESLDAAAKRLGARLVYDPLTGTGSVERSDFRVAFKTGFPFFSFDGALRRLEPVRAEGGVLTLPESSGSALAAYFSERETERKSHFRVAVIVIDPGHGGKDPGAIGEHKVGSGTLRVLEKDLALATALRLRDRLRSAFPDRDIVMTRDTDTYPTLEERVAKAHSVELESNEAVIYVSIHANASFNKKANGYEVWYLDPDYRRRDLVDPKKASEADPSIVSIWNNMLEEEYTTESFMLAKRISTRLAETLGDATRNRGIRAEQWFVVRNAKMPSVLVELGFVTEPDEARKLADRAYLSKLGDAVYNGVVDFIDNFEKRGGTPAP